MIKIANVEDLIALLNNIDYWAKLLFKTKIIENYTRKCIQPTTNNYIFSEEELLRYANRNNISYEDTNGIDDLNEVTADNFKNDLATLVRLIKDNKEAVDTLIKSHKLEKFYTVTKSNYNDFSEDGYDEIVMDIIINSL